MDGCPTVKVVDGKEDASQRRNLRVCVDVDVLYAYEVHNIVTLCIHHHWGACIRYTTLKCGTYISDIRRPTYVNT